MKLSTHQPSVQYLDPKYRDHSDLEGNHSQAQELRNTRAMRSAVECDLFVNGLIMHFHKGNMSEAQRSEFSGIMWDQEQHYLRLAAMTDENVTLLA